MTNTSDDRAMVESQTIVTPFFVKNVLSISSISLQHLFLFPQKLPMATSEAAKPSKKCCISFLVSKLGAKLMYLHQLRAKQSYLQNFTNLFCSLLCLDRLS